MTSETISRRAFISYSWGTPEHEQWVLDLANELVQTGVDVVLDKWDLREGQDKYHFMEKIVTDPAIDKVLVICDRRYATKADERKDGVGAETQIISKEVYERVDQRKFVAVIAELTSDGHPYLPIFLKDRIYIDMSTTERRTSNFEQLLRWIFDQPLYRKPQLGVPPAHLFDERATDLGTAAAFRRAVETIKQGKSNVLGVVRDYLETLAHNLKAFSIEAREDLPLDEMVFKSIDLMKPTRDELLDLILAIARYCEDERTYESVCEFLETMLPYKFPAASMTTWQEGQDDNFAFFIHEVFLYLIGALLKHKRFIQVKLSLERQYYLPPAATRLARGKLANFNLLRSRTRLFDERNERLSLNRQSLFTDVLKTRATRMDVGFAQIMEADFVAYLWTVLNASKKTEWWFPHTLLYSCDRMMPFEHFLRSKSKRYLLNLQTVLGVSSKEELLRKFQEATNDTNFPFFFGPEGFDPLILMNADGLGTAP